MSLIKVKYNKFCKNNKHGTLTNLVILAMSLIFRFDFSAYFNYFYPFFVNLFFFILHCNSFLMFFISYILILVRVFTISRCISPQKKYQRYYDILIILFLNILFRNCCETLKIYKNKIYTFRQIDFLINKILILIFKISILKKFGPIHGVPQNSI